MKIFSFDAETNGLWGQPFQLAAIVTIDGVETARFAGRSPIEGEINSWVKDNVLPAIDHLPETHGSYRELLSDFAKFYLANKADAHVIAHMGYIVEAKVLRDAHEMGFIGDWDGPYPLIDISGNLQQAGYDPTSVDKYAAQNAIELPSGTSHDAIYDCIVAERVYRHLMGC